VKKRRLVSTGHLIDSGILATILNSIIQEGADYEIVQFRIGKTNLQESMLEIDLVCQNEAEMAALTEKLMRHGVYEKRTPEVVLKEAPADGCVPDDFYSTTNHPTEVYCNGAWHEVAKQRMDAVIVVAENGPACRKLRDVRRGERIVCGFESVRVFPPPRDRQTDVFSFMGTEVSSERSVDVVVARIAEEVAAVKAARGKVVAVAGPVVVHTGSSGAFAALIREGYIHGLLAGNALAVHDLESVFFGTSLGVDLSRGLPTSEGTRNHMRAINRIRCHGSIGRAVESGDLVGGIMHEVVTSRVPFCLAGSIRDDGPLPETVTDMNQAQNQYARILEDADMVLMLGTMLHSIGTGNMLPSAVKTVCVDINPAVVTKLVDRGSSQTIGIVSDVGLFLRALTSRLVGSW
jgi:lysine-ketoglutarate reductase/saccharopine dehydrogenase-like protein (TIGR00300 family)